MADVAKPARKKSPKKPCSICRRWFLPDPRVGTRQRACCNPNCQTRRRVQTQAGWRERNRDYFTARRIQARQAQVPPPPPPLRLPRPLEQLPWDLAQDQFGVQGADFIAFLSILMVRARQDQRRCQTTESKGVPSKLPGPVGQDEIASGTPLGQTGAGSDRHATGVSPTRSALATLPGAMP